MSGFIIKGYFYLEKWDLRGVHERGILLNDASIHNFTVINNYVLFYSLLLFDRSNI